MPHFYEDDEEYEVEPKKIDPQIVMAEARFLQKGGQYARAIERYSKILEDDPTHIEALLARSQCYMDNGQLDLSLKDADAATKTHKGEKQHSPRMKPSSLDWKTQLQQANAKFSMGEFEDALLLYHRGRRQRPNIREFRVGITKCRDAITATCINERQKKKAPQAPPPASIPPSIRTDVRHVRKLGGTQKYLQELLQELDSSGKRFRGLASVTRDSLRFLGSRDAYWKQQMPGHVVRRLEKQESRDTPRKQPPSLINQIIKELKKIDRDFREGRYEDCVSMSHKCLLALDLYTEQEIQNKREIQGKIHSFIGSSYLGMDQLEDALEEHQKDLEIAREIKSHKAEGRALDNLGAVYARMGRTQDAITAWESRVPLCTEATERCWLYHELGYLYLDQENPHRAAQYGEQAQAEARKEGSIHSQLTAIILIGQSQALMDNLPRAHDLFTEALQLANQIKDKSATEAIIEKLDELNREMASKQNATTDEQKAMSDLQKTTPAEQKTAPREQKTTPNQQKTTSIRQKATPREQKATPSQQKTTPREQNITATHQKATPGEQKTPREQKSALTQQKTTPREQKATPHTQQKPTPNQQENKHQRKYSKDTPSLKLPSIHAKPQNPYLENDKRARHRPEDKHKSKKTQIKRSRNVESKLSYNSTSEKESGDNTKSAATPNDNEDTTGKTSSNSAPTKAHIDNTDTDEDVGVVSKSGGKQSHSHDQSRSRTRMNQETNSEASVANDEPSVSTPSPIDKKDNENWYPQTIDGHESPAARFSSQDGTTKEVASNSDKAQSPELSYMYKRDLKTSNNNSSSSSKPSNRTKQDDTASSTKPTNHHVKDVTTSSKSSTHQPKAVRFQTAQATSSEPSDLESIDEDMDPENLNRDETGSVNNLRRIQQQQTPRGKNRMKRPATYENRLEILPPSSSSASFAERV